MVPNYKQSAPFGTGASLEDERQARRMHEADVIAAVRLQVFARDRACRCGVCPPRRDDEMHELVPRSRTRGRPPEDRFNMRVCLRLSKEYHEAVTRHRVRIEVVNSEVGANGPVRVVMQARV